MNRKHRLFTTLVAALFLAGLLQTTQAEEGTLLLGSDWRRPLGKFPWNKEFLQMMGRFGEPSDSLLGDKKLEICPGITYLMPRAAAEGYFRSQGQLKTSVTMSHYGACEALPKSSFKLHSYDGQYPGGCNKLFLLTDVKDQVVTVEFFNEHSIAWPSTVPRPGEKPKGRDIVITSGRVLSFSNAVYTRSVTHYSERIPEGGVRVTTMSTFTANKVGFWYIPQPMVNLLLYHNTEPELRPASSPAPKEPKAEASAKIHAWTNKSGKTIQAPFVRLEKTTVVVQFKGADTLIPLADLSPESAEQAKKLGGGAAK